MHVRSLWITENRYCNGKIRTKGTEERNGLTTDLYKRPRAMTLWRKNPLQEHTRQGHTKAQWRRNKIGSELATAFRLWMKLDKKHSSSSHQRAVRDGAVTIPRQTYGNSTLTHSKCRKHCSKGELSLCNSVQQARKGEKRDTVSTERPQRGSYLQGRW